MYQTLFPLDDSIIDLIHEAIYINNHNITPIISFIIKAEKYQNLARNWY